MRQAVRLPRAAWKASQKDPGRPADHPRASACIRSDGGAKSRFSSRSEAKAHAKAASIRVGHKLKGYLCPNCSGYHLAMAR